MTRRLVLAGILAGMLAPVAGGPAAAQNGSVVVVPPAPAISSAPTVLTPTAVPPPGVPMAAPGGSLTPPPTSTLAAPPTSTLAAPPPGLVQTAMPPVTATSSAPGANADTGALPPDTAPPPPPWQMGKIATLGVLNKIDGGTSHVTIPVGATVAVGDLKVDVLACATRPPGQIPDTAIYLSAQIAGAAGTPLYHGWMLRSAPGAAVVGDASETFRVINCA